MTLGVDVEGRRREQHAGADSSALFLVGLLSRRRVVYSSLSPHRAAADMQHIQAEAGFVGVAIFASMRALVQGDPSPALCPGGGGTSQALCSLPAVVPVPHQSVSVRFPDLLIQHIPTTYFRAYSTQCRAGYWAIQGSWHKILAQPRRY